ncbi:MAG: sulfite exporter TauE/SafE family protein [Crocinitomicaceae bacterium]
MIYVSALLLGLASSFHCVLMCGPIAMALPLGKSSKSRKAFGIALYSAGRIVTYILLGVIAGILGIGATLYGIQDAVSLIMGIVIMLFAIFPFILRYFEKNSSRLIWKSKYFSKTLGSLFKSNSLEALFYLGFLNGLIPCGLVYVAIASSLVLGEFYEFALYMFLFGLGTVPLMVLAILFGVEMKKRIVGKYRLVIPVFVFLLGMFLFIRPALIHQDSELRKGNFVGYVKGCILPH